MTAPAALPVADVADATPLAALLLDEMPFTAHFRRDHFPVPLLEGADWALEVAGAVRRPLRLDLAGLRALGAQTERVVLECAGHRRAEYRPPVPGVAWREGAVGEARWTGASLAALLRRAGVLRGARAVVLEGADRGLAGERDEPEPFARALPLAKALAPETTLAWAVNGEALPLARGGPVRAVVPGWYATEAVKWLVRVTVIDDAFDGFFEAEDYRLAGPGDDGPGARMSEAPVHALIVDPAPLAVLPAGPCVLRGAAWGGAGLVAVDVRIDGGPWRRTDLEPPRGRWALRRWSVPWSPARGDHRLEVRATDAAGARQPERPAWNRAGYANNAVHGVDVRVMG